MKHKKGKISTGILYVILLLGVTILSYPFISSWLSKKQGIEVAEDYKKMTVSLSEEEIQEEWEKAYKYNEELLEGPDKNLLDSSESTLPANYNESPTLSPEQ